MSQTKYKNYYTISKDNNLLTTIQLTIRSCITVDNKTTHKEFKNKRNYNTYKKYFQVIHNEELIDVDCM